MWGTPDLVYPTQAKLGWGTRFRGTRGGGRGPADLKEAIADFGADEVEEEEQDEESADEEKTGSGFARG